MSSPPLQARRLLHGFRAFQLTVAACELKIPDLLAFGPKTSAELAAATGTHEPSLHRFLRGLAAWGVVKEDGRGVFSATVVSDSFRSDKAGLRNMALMLDQESYKIWAELPYSLKTGRPAYDHVAGKSHWEALRELPEQAAQFNAAMVEDTRRVAASFVGAYDFDGVGTVIDVGGGSGALLAAVLAAHPQLHGVLFDLPQGLADAREKLAAEGVADRVSLVEGSFFEEVPQADLYLLKWIIHDWDDERAVAILKTCRRAMQTGSRLVLLERILPEHVDADRDVLDVVMGDLNMMVVLGGRERAAEEYRHLLEGAGLHMTSARPAGGSGFGIYEAVPV